MLDLGKDQPARLHPHLKKAVKLSQNNQPLIDAWALEKYCSYKPNENIDAELQCTRCIIERYTDKGNKRLKFH